MQREPIMNNAIERAAGLIDQADALIVAAGAGMGVDSGLPDFRGREGFWRAYPALKQAGVDFYNIASPSAFESTPARAWGFYGHRLALYRRTEPHAGFALLKRWGERMLHGYSVFTSNVDGQFQRAGFDAVSIHECHGSIHQLQCLGPCCSSIWAGDDFSPDVDEHNCHLRNPAPICPRCGRLARPNILMFGDWGWVEALMDGPGIVVTPGIAFGAAGRGRFRISLVQPPAVLARACATIAALIPADKPAAAIPSVHGRKLAP